MPGRLKSSNRSITKEVSMGLVFTFFLVSTISFFIAYSVAGTKAHNYLNAKADEYIQYLKEVLPLPIWNYDYETIDVIGKSFMHNEFIIGITIVDGRGKTCLKEMKPGFDPIVERSSELRLYGQSMGSVRITLAKGYYNIWIRQFFLYFSFIILINLVSLILMSVFLLRWSLNKPLQLLNRIVASYNSRKGGDTPEQMPYMEFHPLIDTLKNMGDEIQTRMAELQKAEKKYRSIFENATEGIFQSTLEGKIIDANPAFASILGYQNPDDLIFGVKNLGERHFLRPEQYKIYIEALKRDQVVKAYEVEIRKKDGTEIWVSLNALPIQNEQGRFLHIEGLVQDITIRKKAEIGLSRLSTAVEQVAEPIIITDADGLIKYVNPAFERNTGYLLDMIYNQSNSMLGADNAERNVYEEILEVVKKGEVWTGRVRSLKKNGALLIEDAIVSPIKNPSGKFLGYVSINRDVTLMAKYENQVRQAQKMEAIGTLAGGIAHDFNNILGVIIGCSQLVSNSLSEKDKAQKDIGQVLTAALRAKSLVSQILTFSRQEPSKRIPVNLSPFIREVIQFLRASVPNFVKITYKKETRSGVILADPIQIQQIIMNICTNAYQAIGQNRGEIKVVLSVKRFEDGDERPPETGPGEYVVIEIEDDGPGISEKIQQNIFDPFFTTKKVGEGTGLGLSVVHGIVKQHEGTILVSSTEGKGTCFTVLFPRVEHKDLKIAIPQMVNLPTGTERILLVDDEKTLLDVLRRIICNLGYSVEAYHEGGRAIDSFAKNPGDFDLVITDQVMPDMTGTRLIREIRAIDANVPVILLTGFTAIIREKADGNQQMADKVLKKPLLNSDLAVAIRKVLDAKQNQRD